MIPRLLTEVLEKTPKSILLIGPRQVGKSTLIEQLAPKLSLNLADEETYLEFKSNPAALKELLGSESYRSVFIDEIQRHPPLLNTIQSILDQKKSNPPKFYITGSSARKLKRGQANLLPGRVLSFELGGLCSAELGYRLDVRRALSRGTLPEPYLETNEKLAEKILLSYAGTYLKEEIQAEAATRNLEGFSRFLRYAGESAGLAQDFSKLAKRAKIERKACGRFFEILEDTLIASRLESFDETDADVVKRPKYYFFDVGVLNGLLGNFTPSLDRSGMLFEHLVVNQILNSSRAHDVLVELSYFRTRGGYEVDLILKIKRQLFAIEIKHGQVGSSEAKNLLQFGKFHKKVDGYFIVVPEGRNRTIEGVRILELNGFLKEVGL